MPGAIAPGTPTVEQAFAPEELANDFKKAGYARA